jgi:hypothetical protein
VQDYFHRQDLVCARVDEIQDHSQLILKSASETVVFWDLDRQKGKLRKLKCGRSITGRLSHQRFAYWGLSRVCEVDAAAYPPDMHDRRGEASGRSPITSHD